jgi:polar amino acid transport system substrate-binding protein
MRAIQPYLIAIVVLIFFSGIGAPPVSAITFLTHDVQGATYTDENGVLRGLEKTGKRAFTVELVRKMMVLLNHPQTVKVVPFKRGFFTLQNEPDYALFNISRKPDRENLVQWVGPLLDEITYLYELKDTPTPVLSLDDARKADRLCVRIGTAGYDILMKKNFKNIHQNSSGAACFKMLAARRVALVSSDINSFRGKLKLAGVSEEKIQQTPVIVHKSQGYIAFSNNISKAEIARWQNALEALKRSGEYDDLVEKYLLTE